MNNVSDYYELIDEDARFSRNSRKIEFYTTNHVMESMLPGRSTILDVGAGTGVYSFHYAERGHEVVAVDLTPKHVQYITQKSRDTGVPIQAHFANATDLSRFDNSLFDVVFCFGPMYHLTSENDRNSCISECLRVLKPGGILAIAYINKFPVLPMLATRDKKFIRDTVIHKVINEGVIQVGDEDCFWTDAYFTSPPEIEAFMQDYDVSLVDHVGTDGVSHTIQEYVDELSDEEFHSWMNYHYQTCRESSILGMSTHGLIICRKN